MDFLVILVLLAVVVVALKFNSGKKKMVMFTTGS